MNKIEKCKAARDYHTHGCNCAQSILAAFHEDMGFTEDQCMALAGGMGGGMRCGSICGGKDAFHNADKLFVHLCERPG